MKIYVEKAKIVSLYALVLVLGWACSDDMDGHKEGNNGGELTGIPVLINADVSSIEISEGQSITRAGEREGNSDVISFVQPLDKNFDTGYDIETTMESVKPVQTRAESELLKNSCFKLLAYTGGTVSAYNYVGQGNFMTDENGVATVVAGQEMKIPSGSYIFVGYSYGKDEELGPQRPDYPFVPVTNGVDFMTYSSPVINVEADATGTFTLRNIKFTRQSVKLQVKITVAGFNEDVIKKCSATLSNLNDRSLNWTIGEATFPLKGASGSIDFTWASPNTREVISEVMYDFPINKRDLVLTLKEMTIGDFVMKNVVINLSDQVFDPSKSYLLTVNLNQNYTLCGDKFLKLFYSSSSSSSRA